MITMHRTIVSALLFSNDEKLFVGRKDPHGGGVYVNYWHIPGGGVKDGEDKLTALKREILEETGIDISASSISMVDNKGHDLQERTLRDTGEHVLLDMDFHVYEVRLDKNAVNISISLNDDLVEYRWITLEELPTIPNTPPSIALFKRLGYLP